MRIFLILVSLSLSLTTQAGTSYPKPLYLPHAEYPEEMLRNKESGKVKVRLFINANGTVLFKDIVKASDPRLAEAVKQVAPTWRFTAWTPPADKPHGESILLSYDFDAQTPNISSLSANVELKKLRCSQLNNELIWTRHSLPVEEAKTFRDTRNYLLNGAVISAFVAEEERQALIDDFHMAKPAIIGGCRENPRAFYADLLPIQLREML
ncbi:TonB family protein [Pseudomonas sp. Irchel 3A5]|uniref:TonB family protein n=1 Tax=Pseudomonas sp. Irchel 3A5 TaxID=2008911 RepID=UPI0015957421|nr:TonB family protein [Pseudomonas sp. Irchel 3A5]